jgi:hypothetical protein
MTTDQVRRWVSGFEAAAQADRELRAREGPRPAWAVLAALSLIDAAAATPRARAVVEARLREDEEVRGIWERLKAALRR